MGRKINIKRNSILLFCSFFIHFLAIYIHFPSLLKENLKIKKNRLKVRLYKVRKKRVGTINKKKKIDIKPTFSKLGITKKSFDFSNIEGIGQIGDNKSDQASSSSTSLEIFRRIDERLDYPTLFVKNNISGRVNIRLVFSKEGFFEEKRSQYQTNSKYLQVHIVRLLRDAFKLPIQIPKNLLSSNYYIFDCSFKFKLSTGLKPLDQGHQKGMSLFFERMRYGGTSKIDKVNKTIGKTLIHVSNFLTLLEYRPNWMRSKKSVVKRMYYDRAFSRYQRDPAWKYN